MYDARGDQPGVLGLVGVLRSLAGPAVVRKE